MAVQTFRTQIAKNKRNSFVLIAGFMIFFVGMGLLIGMVWGRGSWPFAMIVAGVAATKEMILLGRRFSAKAAQAYGLVHQVVLPQELDAAVEALVGRFQSLPPRTVGITKRIIDKGHNLSLRESQDLEVDAQAEVLYGPDVREALESFLENRRPVFTGE